MMLLDVQIVSIMKLTVRHAKIALHVLYVVLDISWNMTLKNVLSVILHVHKCVLIVDVLITLCIVWWMILLGVEIAIILCQIVYSV